MLCPRCKQPVRDGAKFCDSCGQTMDTAPGSPAAGGASPAGPAAGGPAATVIRRPMAASGGPGAAGPGAAGPGGGGSGAGTWTAGAAGGGSAAFTNALNDRFPGLFDRVKNILLTPKTEWPVIDPEQTTVAKLYTGYVIPLAAFAALMRFLNMSVIGSSIPFAGTFRVPFMTGLVTSIELFVFNLVGLYLWAFLINLLAPTFGGQRDLRQAVKISAYTATAVWVGSVFSLLPVFASLLQLAVVIYAIYLLHLGLALMRRPQEKAVGYTVAVIVCVILAGLVLGTVSYLTGFGRYSGYGGFNTAITRAQQQEQAQQAVSNAIGSALGSDDKSKQGLAAAINGFAEIGRKMEQQQAANGGSNASPPGAGGTATAAGNTQDGAAAAANVLSALGGAMAGNRKVDPVDFHALKDLLPGSLPGMQRVNAEGSSQAALGMKSSEATATYQGTAGARAEIKIADVSAVAGLMDAAGGIAQSVTSESDTGFERNATVAGQIAHEKYDNQSKHGELSVIVAKRFAVDVSGDAVDMSALEQYAGARSISRGSRP
jgi:hypothetical protein